jgi:hypothetical protein
LLNFLPNTDRPDSFLIEADLKRIQAGANNPGFNSFKIKTEAFEDKTVVLSFKFLQATIQIRINFELLSPKY